MSKSRPHHFSEMPVSEILTGNDNEEFLCPLLIERDDYVCFIGGNNDDEIFFGRVTKNAKQVKADDKENRTNFFTSVMEKFRPSPVIKVNISGEFGYVSNNHTRFASMEFFVDEDKAAIVHSERIQEGFQVLKEGIKGQIQKNNFSSKMAHIKIHGMDAVIPFVKVADLMPPHAYKVRAGQVVILGDWIGDVKLINRHIVVRLQDNTVTEWELEETDPLLIHNGDGHWNPYEAFFVGQFLQMPQLDKEKYGLRVRRLYSDGSGFLLRCSDVPQENIVQPPNESLCGIVESITILAVKIEWMKRIPGSTMLKPEDSFFKTEALTVWENLKVLDHLSGDYVRIGSNRLYTVKKNDKVLTHLECADSLMKTWFPLKFSSGDKNQRPAAVEQMEIEEGVEYRVEVILLYTGIEVAWDDGNTSVLSAPELYKCIFACPIEMAEFKVGCIVEKCLPFSEKNTLGVVRKVVPVDFTLLVNWFRRKSNGDIDCMGSKEVSCFDVIRLDHEPRPLSNSILTGGAWPNEVRWSYPFGKLCVVRKDNLVENFKAAVVLNQYYADVNGKITAFCGNEVLSLSPFEVTNAEDVFEAKKPPQKKYNKAVLVSKTESLVSIPFERLDKIDGEVSNDNPKSFFETGPTNFSILPEAPIHHYFAQIQLDMDPKNISALKENSKQLALDLNEREGLSDIWIYTYQDRPDLMSILISGKYGTPYFGGLFAFELYLTVDFPREVPLVMYIGPVSLPSPVLGHFDSSKRVCSLLGAHDSFHSDWRIKWDPKNCTLVDIAKLLRSSIHLPNSALHDGLSEKATQAMFNGFCIIEILSAAYKILEDPSTLKPWGPRLEKQYPLVVLSLMESVQRWTNEMCEEKPEFDLFPLSKAVKLGIETRLELLKTLEAVKKSYAKKSS